MVDTKLTGLTAITTVTTDDLLYLVDDPGGTPLSRKITKDDLFGTSTQEYEKTQNFNATTLTDAATIAWDASSNQVTQVTITDNRTMGLPTNLIDGGTYVLHVIQDATGSRTITWNAIFKWSGGTAPTLTTTASARDIISFISDGTNMYGIDQLDFS